MKKLVYKIAAGAAYVSLMATLLAPVAFAADETLTISGNGNGSHNTIVTTSTNDCTVTQKNKTEVGVEAIVSANTGGNTANGNVGSGVTIGTGDASSALTVSVDGSSNTATNPCCGCQTAPTTDASITGNGNNSINTVVTTSSNSKTVRQRNKTSVGVSALVKSKTGKNTTNGNVGGTVGVTTGTATSTLDVTVTGSTNTL